MLFFELYTIMVNKVNFSRCKQQIKLARNCKTKRSWLETVLSLWIEILQNCVCVAVYEIPTSLESALSEKKIQKHVRSTQYQFRVFKNVDCFMSLRRCYFHKAVMLLFCNSTMQRYKGNVGCACSKTSTLETCSDSVWYFISFNADCLQCKVLCYDSQTDPRCAPVLNYTYISVHFVVCGRSLIYTWKVWSALISRNWCYFTMDIDYLGSATMVWFLNIYFLYVDSELNLAISILTRTSISITILSTDCTLLCTLGKYLTLCK